MANRYWVNGSGNWDDYLNHWATSSGGTSGGTPSEITTGGDFTGGSGSWGMGIGVTYVDNHLHIDATIIGGATLGWNFSPVYLSIYSVEFDITNSNNTGTFYVYIGSTRSVDINNTNGHKQVFITHVGGENMFVTFESGAICDFDNGSILEYLSILPTTSDNVFLDSNSGLSGQTITLNASAVFNDFTSTTGVSFTIINSFNGLDCYGSLTFESGITYAGDVEMFATSAGEQITTGGATLGGISFYGIGGGWALQDDLLMTDSAFYIENGTFDANDHNVTANDFYFYADTGYNPTVIMGSGTWEATGNSYVWFLDQYSGEYITIMPETSTIKLSNSSTTQKIFAYYDDTSTITGTTYYNLWLTGSGTGVFQIWGSNTFNEFRIDTPPHTILFNGGETSSVNSFVVSRTNNNVITINNYDTTTQHNLSKSSGTVICDYLDISNSNATGGATWYAGSHSNDTTNNDGWIFTDPTWYNKGNFLGLF